MNAPKNGETVFAEALSLPPPDRAAYIAQATLGRPELFQEVQSLLESYNAGEFLEQAASPELRATFVRTAPAVEGPGDTIGRYKLLQQIGEGGCGVVYLAEQTEPVRRRVALKVLKLGLDSKAVIARFEAERQALALMDHPNIARILDGGVTEAAEVREHDSPVRPVAASPSRVAAGRPYFVMELVRGMKITDYCDEANLAPRARLDLFIQVCLAIQHAHQKGIIHRDIKPSNILVTVNDGVAVPKVIDFGIAKAMGGQSLTDKTVFTAFEQFLGTPAYMSPEQAALTSVDIDTRSDVYALGVLLYELLTGRTPFDAKTLLAAGLDALRRTIREQEPPRPSTRLIALPGAELSTTAQRRGLEARKLVSELHGDLDWIVMKALEKDRARRYDTASGLAADVQRHLHHEPVLACPPSQLDRLRKWARRNRLALSAAAAVLLALVFGLGTSLWMWSREREARQQAVLAHERAERVAERETREHERAEAHALAETQQRRRAEAEERSARLHLYAAHMNIARRACEEGNARRAIELLEVHRPKPAQEDLRGFEWYYLWGRCHQERHSWSLTGSGPGAEHNASVAFAAHANILAVVLHAGHFHQAVEEAKPLRPLPNPDSNHAVLLLQELTTGRTLGSTRLPDHAPAPDGGKLISRDSLHISPDGRHLALPCWSEGSGRYYVALWDVGAILEASEKSVMPRWWAEQFPPATEHETLERLWALAPSAPATAPVLLSRDVGEPAGNAATGFRLIRSLVFSGDGQWMAAAEANLEPGAQGPITVWNLANHSVITNFGRLKSVGSRWVTHLSRDERVLSADCLDEPLASSHWETGSWRALTNRNAGVRQDGSAFAPESDVVALSRPGRQSPAVTRSEYLDKRARGLLVWSPDASTLALARDEAIELWEARTGRLLHTFAGHAGLVYQLGFLPDGRTLASVASDGCVKLWDLSTLDEGTLLFSAASLTRSVGVSVALRYFSPDGKRVVLWRPPRPGPRDVVFRDVQTGAELVLGSTSDPPGQVSVSEFSPDGSMVAGVDFPPPSRGGANVQVKVWDADSGKVRASFDAPRSGIGPAFSPDGNRLLYGTQPTIVWDLERQVELRRFTNFVTREFRPFGRHGAAITVNPDGITDLETGRNRKAPFLDRSEFALSPDGKTVAFVLKSLHPMPLVLWDWSTGEQRLVLGQYLVSSLAFSPDGKTLAGAARDGSIRLWQVSTGDELFSLPAPPGGIHELTFAPDGRGLLGRDRDSLYMWRGAKTSSSPQQDIQH